MKRLIYALLPLAVFWLISCQREDKLLTQQKIQFSISNTTAAGKAGRVAAAEDPQQVLVTIKDGDGNTVAEQQSLTLYKFGDHFLSAPFTLAASKTANYSLSEFFVIGADQKVAYASPREGSKLAHLVNDPLDISFRVDANQITTVSPEVLAVDSTSDASDYGYGQFGFSVVKKIDVVISSFLRGENNFELTKSHLKIEGVRDSSYTDTTALWSYEVDLLAKANNLSLRQYPYYKITATKDGYQPWKRTLSLHQGSKLEILFEKAGKSVDVYLAGSENGFATYWKNGTAITLSTVGSRATGISVSKDNIYVSGFETSGTPQAFYWKNAEKVTLPQAGFANGITVVGEDVYVGGSIQATDAFTYYPVYWKNGEIVKLETTTSYSYGGGGNIVVSGSDIYITGKITNSHGYTLPAVWKNGHLTILPVPSSEYLLSTATSVTINNGHIYVSGIVAKLPPSSNKPTPRQAAYWKDGQLTTLVDTSLLSEAQDIAVSGDDIYVTGFQSDASTGWAGEYWKNNQAFSISAEGNVNLHAISVINSDIYVAGEYRAVTGKGTLSPATASYWLNGTRVQCGSGAKTSYSFAMCVIAR
jgi:hypothetical protein